jgi:hypothetical protein
MVMRVMMLISGAADLLDHIDALDEPHLHGLRRG